MGQVLLMAGGVPPEVDPLWSNVVFLSDFDGADESTAAFPDLTARHTITPNTGKLDNTHVQFGSTALFSDNAGIAATVPTSTDFDFGNSAFCIEYSYYQPEVAGIYEIMRKYDSPQRTFHIRHNATAMHFFYSTDGSDNNAAIFSAGVGSANNWHQYCLERDGSNNLRFFRNGVMIVKNAFSVTFASGKTSTLTINWSQAGQSAWMDATRITKGAFRYGSDSSYTPRTSAFPHP